MVCLGGEYPPIFLTKSFVYGKIKSVAENNLQTLIFEEDKMGFDLLLIAIGLSMDAFAVAICKGLAVGKAKTGHMLLAGLWFGGFQGLMPLIGYFLGTTFSEYINQYDHWIAFVLLAFIGGKMIKESFEKEESNTNASFGFSTMLVMAIATSIDALAVGVSFALLPECNIWLAVSLIGVITFAFGFFGVKIGSVFGAKYKSRAELAGGVILVGMGIKILIEHLFV